jgi:hypothetical protein
MLYASVITQDSDKYKDYIEGVTTSLNSRGYVIRDIDPFDLSYKSMDMDKLGKILSFIPEVRYFMKMQGLRPEYFAPAVACVLGVDLKSRSKVVVYHLNNQVVGYRFVVQQIAMQLKIETYNLASEEVRSYLQKYTSRELVR